MNSMNQQPQAKWNIMVYIAADDVLANFAIESVKQLRRAAGKDIVVAVQLDVDGPFARQRLRRFIFDGLRSEDAKIEENLVPPTLDPTTNMIDPQTLTEFINWAYQQPRCNAKRHCLILWGHGPELLAESAPAGKEALKNPVPGGDGRLYLTPQQLARAVKNANIGTPSRPKFDIIAFDACSSSIGELAAELPAYANFMIASQEDVPDMSFPYELFLQLIRANADDVHGICKIAVEKYLTNYQDFVFGPNTDTSKVTLSSLDLDKFKSVEDAITNLAEALLPSVQYPDLSRLIFDARGAAHGFVGGLFVDLYDFCDQLIRQPQPKSATIDNAVKKNADNLVGACQEVIRSLTVGEKDCVIANAVLDPRRCHGLSLYFPYRTEDAQNTTLLTDASGTLDLTKGDPRILDKGDPRILDKGDPSILDKVRRERITEIEADYQDLALPEEETRWYNFIQAGWSRILAEQLKPEELDVRYSAQQCAVNLLATSKFSAGVSASQSKSQTSRTSQRGASPTQASSKKPALNSGSSRSAKASQKPKSGVATGTLPKPVTQYTNGLQQAQRK